MCGPGRPRCPTDAVLGEMLAHPRPHRQDWCGHLQIVPVVFGRVSEQGVMGKESLAVPASASGSVCGLLQRVGFGPIPADGLESLFSAESCQGRERAFLGCCSAP